MFMLSPDGERPSSRVVWWSGIAALVLIALASPIVAMVERTGFMATPDTATGLAATLGLVSLILYGVDLAFFYRYRKRRVIELNSRAAQGAFLALILSTLLLLALLATGTLGQHIGAFLYLVAFGW